MRSPRNTLGLDEELELVRRYQRSIGGGPPDVEAAESLINVHLRMIAAEARKRYSANKSFVELEELINVGCAGFLEGCFRFDTSRRLRVSTYALYWTRFYIHAAIRAYRWSVTLDDQTYKDVIALSKALARQPLLFDRRLDYEFLAARLNWSAQHLVNTMTWMKSTMSLETPVSRNGQLRLIDVIVATPSGGQADRPPAFDHRVLYALLDRLNPLEVSVLERLFGLRRFYGRRKTTNEIAAELRRSADSVRDIQKTALKKLRSFSQASELFRQHMGLDHAAR